MSPWDSALSSFSVLSMKLCECLLEDRFTMASPPKCADKTAITAALSCFHISCTCTSRLSCRTVVLTSQVPCYIPSGPIRKIRVSVILLTNGSFLDLFYKRRKQKNMKFLADKNKSSFILSCFNSHRMKGFGVTNKCKVHWFSHHPPWPWNSKPIAKAWFHSFNLLFTFIREIKYIHKSRNGDRLHFLINNEPLNVLSILPAM